MLNSVFDTKKAIANLSKPLDQCRGLPNSLYVSREGFQLEQKYLFPKSWFCLASANDVPRPGDAMPTQFGDLPLMLIRDNDGKIRVFHNVCLHRGMILLRQKKRFKGLISCPYHSWTYDLQGKLLKTPKAGGDNDDCGLPDRDCMGLKEVRCHVWMQTVYINLDGDAPAFQDVFADLLKRWGEYESAPLHHADEESHFDLTLACNWKLAVENYCESYHLPWVHPGLNTYSRIEDHYHIEEKHYSGQGTTVYAPNLGSNRPKFPNHKGLSSKWHKGAEYVALYPNALLGIHRDHFYSIRIEPINCEKTREIVDIYYFSEEAAKSQEYRELRLANRELWKGIFKEDVFAVEGMQRGRHSPAFDGGRFTPKMDGPTYCFHRWVASTLAA